MQYFGSGKMETFAIFAMLFTQVRVIKYIREKYKYLKIELKHSSTQSGPEVLTVFHHSESEIRSPDFRGFT